MVSTNTMERKFRRELSKYDLGLHKRYGKDSYYIYDARANTLVAPTPYYGERSEFSLEEAMDWFEDQTN